MAIADCHPRNYERRMDDVPKISEPLKGTTLLSVEDLAIGFEGAPANAIDGISFDVRSGETLAVVGESGCGKSLTALAIMGLLPARAKIGRGTVRFQGSDLLR